MRRKKGDPVSWSKQTDRAGRASAATAVSQVWKPQGMGHGPCHTSAAGALAASNFAPAKFGAPFGASAPQPRGPNPPAGRFQSPAKGTAAIGLPTISMAGLLKAFRLPLRVAGGPCPSSWPGGKPSGPSARHSRGCGIKPRRVRAHAPGGKPSGCKV